MINWHQPKASFERRAVHHESQKNGEKKENENEKKKGEMKRGKLM